MYTRSYYDNEGVAHPLSVGYDGTALCDEPPAPKVSVAHTEVGAQKAQTKLSPKETERPVIEECSCTDDSNDKRGEGGFFGQIRSIFSGFLPSRILPEKFGLEELLILGLAIYLFFSSSHDREFSLMLLALIFISN